MNGDIVGSPHWIFRPVFSHKCLECKAQMKRCVSLQEKQ